MKKEKEVAEEVSAQQTAQEQTPSAEETSPLPEPTQEENASAQLPDARPISRWREFGLQKGVLRI